MARLGKNATVVLEQNWLTGGGASVNGQAGLAGLMIKRESGPWTLTGGIDGSWGSYSSTRTIAVGTQLGTATASPDVADVGAHAKAAYRMPLFGAAYIEPSVTLGVLYTNVSSYAESGSTSFNLNVHGSNTTTASVSPMVEVGTGGALGGYAVRGFIDVGMAAYSNSDWRGTADLQSAPTGTGSFSVDSKLPSVVGKVNVGADVAAGGGFGVMLMYSADVASGFLSQVILAKLSYSF
jgi:uncharacterized protein with beta-barrel porin domain